MTESQNVKWYRWDDMPKESLTEMLDRRLITGDKKSRNLNALLLLMSILKSEFKVFVA